MPMRRLLLLSLLLPLACAPEAESDAETASLSEERVYLDAARQAAAWIGTTTVSLPSINRTTLPSSVG